MLLARFFTVAAVGVMLALVPKSSAEVVAYDNPVQTGNQSYSGSLGLDFNVLSSPIDILSLGAFDADGDGFNSAITVAIYDRTTQNQVVTIPNVLSGVMGTLINGSRFQSLLVPITLGPGQYSIVAWGYSEAELNGNSGCVGLAVATCYANNDFIPSTLNGSGLLEFVGTGRYGSAGFYPDQIDGGPTANRYLAGTFTYRATYMVPEPATFGLMGLSLVGLALIARRRP